MNELQVTSSTIAATEARVKISDVRVKERLRDRLNEENVQRLMQSFQSVGLQIHPITVDEHHVLISGEHRLEAARRLTEQGIKGWDTLHARVVTGATDHDHRWIELEENQARAEMSPVEILKAWESYGKPLFQAKARERQSAAADAALHARGIVRDPMLIGNTNKHDRDAPVSLVKAARQTTGKDLDWLNKVEDVRQLAENEATPRVLREAAQRGLERLSKPGASVEPVWKALLKLQTQVQQSMSDLTNAEEARVARLEKQLDQSVKEVTLLEDRLGKGLAVQLREAAKVAPLGTEMLRSIRVSLTKSLAEVMVAECLLTNDPYQTLNVVGGEATQLLASHTTHLTRALQAKDESDE